MIRKYVTFDEYMHGPQSLRSLSQKLKMISLGQEKYTLKTLKRVPSFEGSSGLGLHSLKNIRGQQYHDATRKEKVQDSMRVSCVRENTFLAKRC